MIGDTESKKNLTAKFTAFCLVGSSLFAKSATALKSTVENPCQNHVKCPVFGDLDECFHS